MKQKTSIQSVDRALDILELVAQARGPVRSADVATQLGLHTNTANNILRSLYRRGYLTQNQERRYTLGPACTQLAGRTDRWSQLREASSEILRALSEETRDLSFLGVLDAGKLLCLAMAEATGNVIVSARQAWTDRPHCSATGKVLLAALPEDRLALFLKSTALKTFTSHTVTDKEELSEQLAKIRTNNCALCRDEVSDGISAVAVPVYNAHEETIAALGSSFPSYFLDSGQVDVDRRVDTLRRYASRLTNSLSATTYSKDSS